MIRAVLFDLDDTLTKSKQHIDEQMVAPFANLMAHTTVAIVSGASFEQQLKQFISGLPKDSHFENLYSFPENAAKCCKWNDGEWKTEYAFSFKEGEAEEIIKALESVLTETHIVDNEPSYGPRIENRGAQVTFSALGQQAPVEMKHVWDPDQQKRKMIAEKLYPLLPNYDIKIGGGTSIDITQKGINKTYSIKWLSEKLNIPISDMTYVGDSLFPGGNDAVVIETEIPTIETKNPEQTIEIINEIVKNSSL